ncbi:hypothetical protein GFS31_33680 [Leptolyngbya sp. BL0902]|nr:hypothetical protein GFS31_33680 [Leptolyngbya sp. BL0902]
MAQCLDLNQLLNSWQQFYLDTAFDPRVRFLGKLYQGTKALSVKASFSLKGSQSDEGDIP